VSAAIWAKPGRLTDEEWSFVERHPVIGEPILASASALASAARIVRSTHERFDGTGYPDSLVGDQIPLESRIIAVCDAYHAMTSQRPYRDALGHAGAIDELVRCPGSQFDPEVVEAFVRVLAGGAPAPWLLESLEGEDPVARRRRVLDGLGDPLVLFETRSGSRGRGRGAVAPDGEPESHDRRCDLNGQDDRGEAFGLV
jgi:hypothetical protein